MKKKFSFVILLILVSSILLSGCSVVPTAWPGLSTDGKVVYLANGFSVYAVNADDGKEKWHYPLQSNSHLSFYAIPAIAPNGLVIVGSSGTDHSLIAINPAKFPKTIEEVNGVQKFFCGIGLAVCPEYHVEEWMFTGAKDHWVASPLVLNDKVFAPNSDGIVYVLSLKDGSLIQEVTPKTTSSQPDRLWARPVSDGKYVYVASLDHVVFAIDAQTNKIVWQTELTSAIPGGIMLGPDNMLYAGTIDKKLEQLDPSNGNHKSILDTKGWIWGAPVADGDNLYFSDTDGYLYSYNIKAGRLNWEPVQPGDTVTADPLVESDRIIIATESGNMYSVSKDGKSDLWRPIESKEKAYTTPVLAGDYVLVTYVNSTYYLEALDKDGNKKWTYPSGQ